MHSNNDLDPVFASDRNTGSVPPESTEESNNIVGRPVDEGEHAVGLHERTETDAMEREPLSSEEALSEGGSYDGLGVPVADDQASIRPE